MPRFIRQEVEKCQIMIWVEGGGGGKEVAETELKARETF